MVTSIRQSLKVLYCLIIFTPWIYIFVQHLIPMLVDPFFISTLEYDPCDDFVSPIELTTSSEFLNRIKQVTSREQLKSILCIKCPEGNPQILTSAIGVYVHGIPVPGLPPCLARWLDYFFQCVRTIIKLRVTQIMLKRYRCTVILTTFIEWLK